MVFLPSLDGVAAGCVVVFVIVLLFPPTIGACATSETSILIVGIIVVSMATSFFVSVTPGRSEVRFVGVSVGDVAVLLVLRVRFKDIVTDFGEV